MLYQQDGDLVRAADQELQTNATPAAPSPVEPVAADVGAAVEANGDAVATPSRYAEAGRKGARRIHELIQEGRLYEQEHGLKRGRQRIRQLIELGKLYEEEHGLRPVQCATLADRVAQLSEEDALQTFLHALLPLVKPGYRGRLLEVLQGLDVAAVKEVAQAS